MRKLMRKWNWLCPPLMMAVAVWIFTLLGFTVWAAVFMALLLVCPAIIIYALVKMTRSKAGLLPETLHTRGMPLDVLAPIYDRYCPLIRSEEHTSELQSQSNLVCRLLLEKKERNLARAPRVARTAGAERSG